MLQCFLLVVALITTGICIDPHPKMAHEVMRWTTSMSSMNGSITVTETPSGLQKTSMTFRGLPSWDMGAALEPQQQPACKKHQEH